MIHAIKSKPHIISVRILKTPKALVSTDANGEPSVNLYLSAVLPQKVLVDGPGVFAAAANNRYSAAHRAKLGKVVTAYFASIHPNKPTTELSYVAGVNAEGFVVLTFVNQADCVGQVQ